MHNISTHEIVSWGKTDIKQNEIMDLSDLSQLQQKQTNKEDTAVWMYSSSKPWPLNYPLTDLPINPCI